VSIPRITIGAILVSALASPAFASASAEPAAAKPKTVRVTRARWRVEGVPPDAFASALALRLPGVELVPHDRPVGPTQGLLVFVDIRQQAPRRFALTIVVADGRAFDRVIEADATSSEDDVTRLLASNVGNLVAGIEAGTVEPDRRDVPMPVVEPAPAPVCPKCPAAPPTAPPVAGSTRATVPPRIEIGLQVPLGVIVGLGAPADTDRFAAWGGGLGLRLRAVQGVVATLEGRFTGRSSAFDLALLRTRVALGLGYAWRGKHVELEALALATIEPWMLLQDGDRSRFAADARSRPLLGGALRFSPGWLAQPSPRVRMRFGPKLELALSSAIGDGGRVAQILFDDGERLVPVARLGGVELDLGVELVVWFDPRRPKPRTDAVTRRP